MNKNKQTEIRIIKKGTVYPTSNLASLRGNLGDEVVCLEFQVSHIWADVGFYSWSASTGPTITIFPDYDSEVDFYPEETTLSFPELNEYQVFSGHSHDLNLKITLTKLL